MNTKSLINFFLVLLPIIVGIYLLFYLESNGILTIENPHRGKLSVTTLAIGLFCSLKAYSFLNKR
ncbi:MAG: hypothetical protein QF513_02900 [Gammaproteobacteria bacterium]|nr:hypothetical protein [Gammaproteobacteria bacterium]HJM08954.1 hypothetical protein [Gammaproteobacteria bacterium]HJN01412.1 hypothetical protein [Gammaproteobacteria bacterium]